MDAIAFLILEQYGRVIDFEVNGVETGGDKGALFAKFVQGETVTTLEVQASESQDDLEMVVLDQQNMITEQDSVIIVNKPNLVISSENLPEKIAPGELKEITWTVTNTGNITAQYQGGLYYDRIYLSSDPTLDQQDIQIWSDYLNYQKESFNSSQRFNLELAPGESYSNDSYDDNDPLEIPNDIALGTWYLLFKADADGRLSESNEDDNLLVQEVEIGLPNLKVTQVTAPDSINVGETITVSWVVSNEGEYNTGQQWYDHVYWSEDLVLDENDRRIGRVINNQPLKGEESYTQTQEILIPSDLSSNQGYLLVKTNAEKAPYSYSQEQRESDSTDNVLAFSFGEPLVFVNDIETFESANQAIFEVFLSKDYEEEVTVSYTLTDGTAISGQDYANNTDTITFAPGETSKNVIVGLINEHRVEIDETFTIQLTDASNATLFDQQATATILNDDQIQLSNTSVDENPEDGTIVGLFSATDPNDPSPFTFSLINDAGGRFLLVDNQLQIPNGSLLDYENDQDHQITVRATDEDGNNFNRSFEITVNDLQPDLYISSIAVGNNQLTIGDSLNLTWTITNQGNEDTESTWTDYIYLSKDNSIYTTSDNLRYEYEHQSTLAKFASVDQQVTIPIPADFDGDYNLIIVTDAMNQIVERDNNNNTQFYSQKITITNPQPNLQVTNINAPNELFLGQETEIEWTIENIGDGATANQTWDERVWLSLDDEIQPNQDINLGTVSNLNNLISNDGYNNSLTVTIPDNIAETNYYLIVEADYNNMVAESVETDNIKFKVVNVKELPPEPKPDLQVTNVQTSSRAIAGYDITVSYAVTNFGTVATLNDSWIDSVYLSTDENLDVSNDIFLGDYSYNGILDQNERYSVENLSFALPSDIDGEFYVFVLTDRNEEVDEDVFESNNSNYDSDVLTVYATFLPDLEIELTTPQQVRAGEVLTLNYQIQNNGLAPTPNQAWKQKFYLSQDTTLDTNSAIYLGEATYQGIIEQSNSVDLSFETVINYNLEGAYYVYAVTDTNDAVTEIFEDNNTNTAPNFVQILSLPPDLIVSEVTVTNSAEAGENIDMQWKVTNQGSGDSFVESWVDAVYLQDESGNNILLDTFTHQGLLDSNASYIQSQSVTIPNDFEGDYSLYVVTDLNNQVFEKNAENNNQSELKPINIIRNLPDLIVSDISLSQETDIDSGSTITVTWTVTNQGEKATEVNRWIDRVYLRDELGSNSLLETVTHQGSLGVDETYTTSTAVSFDVSLQGNYQIFVVTDILDVVEEDDKEDNNTSAMKPINIIRQNPDLIVSLINPPTQGEANQSVLVSWQVTNEGTRDSIVSSWVDRIYLVNQSGEETLLNAFNHNGLLSQGDSYTRQESVKIPFDFIGDYSLLVETDSFNQVYEADSENNNQSALQPINITRNSADLQVTNVSFNPASLEYGQAISVNWEVTNQGNAATNSNYWYDSVYLSLDDSYSQDDIYIGRLRHSNPLNNGISYQATANFTIPAIAVDNYHVIVRTDSSNLVYEPNLDDNNDGVSTTQVGINPSTESNTNFKSNTNLRRLIDPNNPNDNATLSPEFTPFTPDLVVTSVNVNATEILSYQLLEVSWTVENQRYTTGDQSWYDTVYLSETAEFNPETAISIGSRLQANLINSGSYTQTDNYLLPRDLEGNYYVHVVTDSNDRIDEIEAESNNTNYASNSILITAVEDPSIFDLVVEDISFEKAEATVDEQLTINYTVSNQGSENIVGSWYDSIYLSEDDQWDLSDALVAKILHEGGVASEDSYTKSVTAIIPGLTVGDYSVIVRSDLLNQIPEANKTNNENTSTNSINIDVPVLTIESPITDQLETGESDYSRIEVESGGSLLINLDSELIQGFNELYISHENIPTRGEFDYRYQGAFEADQQVLIPNTKEGNYYILAYGNDTSQTSANYTLSAELVYLRVFNKDFGVGGTAGNRTIEINGNNFDRSIIVNLLDDDGFELTASEYYWVDETKFYATFDLTQANIGIYDVILTNSDDEELVIEDSFEVAAGGGNLVEVSLDAPGAVRPPLTDPAQPFNFELSWQNEGLNDALTPLWEIRSNAPISLDSDQISTVGSSEAENVTYLYGTSFEYYGIANHTPPGILAPSTDGEIYVYGLIDPNPNDISIRVYEPTVEDIYPWDDLKDTIQPNDLSEEEFESIFEQLVTQVGETWGDFLEMVSRNINLLMDHNNELPSLSEIIEIELNKVLANISESSIQGKINAPNLQVELANEELIARNTTTDEIFIAKVLHDGTFIFPSITIGEYIFEYDSGLITNGTSLQLNEEKITDLTLNVELGSTIRGRLTAANNGTSVKDANISLVKRNDSLNSIDSIISIATDERGYYTIPHLEDGTYELTISASGFVTETIENIVINSEEVIEQNLILETAAQLIGTVTDSSSNNTIANVAVLVISEDLNQATSQAVTDEEGNFEVTGLAPRTYQVQLIADEFTTKTLNNIIIAEGSNTLDSIELISSSTISGQITDSSGNPLDNLDVWLVSEDNQLLQTTVTDFNGDYSFEDVDAGNLKIQVGNYPNSISSINLEMQLETDINTANLSLSIEANIANTLLDINGNPVADGIVSVYDQDGNHIVSVATDDQGQFELNLLQEGNYKLGAFTQNSIYEIVDFSTSDLSQISFNQGQRNIRGTVIDESGLPLINAQVRAILDSNLLEDQLAFATETDSNGNYSFEGLIAGDYKIIVDNGIGTENITLNQTDINSLTINTVSPTRVSGLVEDDSGNPIENALVSIYQAGDMIPLATLVTNTEGEFSLEGLVEGSYDVDIYAEKYQIQRTKAFEISNNSGLNILETILHDSHTSITGNILTEDGEALESALIEIKDNFGRTLITTFSENDGTYKATGLPEEIVTLEVSASGFIEQKSSDINLSINPNQEDISTTLLDAIITSSQALQFSNSFPLSNQNIALSTLTRQLTDTPPPRLGAALYLGEDHYQKLPNQIQDKYDADYEEIVNKSGKICGTLPNIGKLEPAALKLQEAGENLYQWHKYFVGTHQYYQSQFDSSATSLLATTVKAAGAILTMLVGAELAAIAVVAATIYKALDAIIYLGKTAINEIEYIFGSASSDLDVAGLVKTGSKLNTISSEISKVTGIERSVWGSTFGKIFKYINNLITGYSLLESLSKGVSETVDNYHSYKQAYDQYQHKKQAYEQIKQEILNGDPIIEATARDDNPDPGVTISGNVLLNDYPEDIYGSSDGEETGCIYEVELTPLSLVQLEVYKKSLTFDLEKNGRFTATAINGFEGKISLVYELTVSSQDRKHSDTQRATIYLNFTKDEENEEEEKKPKVKTEIPKVIAYDPNDILGPEGFGEENWIPGDQPLNYTIRFENDPELASAPAQQVRIVQQLDSDLDFRSFRLGDFGFGEFVFEVPDNQPYYQTRLDLIETYGVYVDVFAGIDVNTKEILWELTTIDPETGEIPANPLTGFLPPNLNGIEGQGFVNYSINAIEDLPTGTVIDAEATIFFDHNEPIDTPPIFNTIDNGEPTSTIQPLPTVSDNPEILVQWTGNEEEGGSAIASYSVYVSKNGESFTPWLENTTLTEATYVGEMGNTYEFYSVAVDNAGNQQQTPISSQAIITLDDETDTPPEVNEAIASFTVNEDAPNDSIDVSNVFSDADGDDITVSFSNNNPGLVNVSLENNFLTLDYLENQSGEALITLTGTANGASVDSIFMITVNPVDDLPFIANPIEDVNVNEDAPDTIIDLTDVFSDVDNDDSLITKSVLSNDNPSLVTATIVDNELILDYQENQSGSATLTIQGTSNGKTVEDTFTITVDSVDDLPFIANPINDVTVNEDAENTVIDLTDVFSDVDNDDSSITKSVLSNSNSSLVIATIVDNELILDYQANQSGSAILTIQGTSNAQTIEDTFTITVDSVDDLPFIANPIDDVTLNEDAPNTIIDLTNVFSDVDNDNSSITKSVLSNSNSSLVTATIVDNELTLDYQANQSGSAILTIQGTSNGQTVEDTFTITVDSVDDLPFIANPIDNVTVNEDAENTVIDLTNVFSDIDNDDSSITKSVLSNDNPSLVTATIVDNELTLDYQANQSGSAILTIQGTSNGETVEDSFTITVDSVDDLPFIANPIEDVNVNEDAPNTIINLSNVFSDIDNDDSSITKSVLSNSNPSLVTATIVDNELILDYQENQSGSAILTIQGISNGETIEDSFTITVDSVDDLPFIANSIDDVTVNEDAENTIIDLTDVFSDIDNDDSSITKSVLSNSNPSLVIASIEGNNLTLDYQENQSGRAILTIQGISNGKIVEDSFTITVDSVDDLPFIAHPINDVTVNEDAENTIIDLTNVFTDIDNDDELITKSILSNSNSNLVTATIVDNELILDYQENQSGSAILTIQGISNGKTVEDNFTLTVNPVNDAPIVANPLTNQIAEANSPFNWTIPNDTFTDVDHPTLTYTTTNLPTWLTFDSITGEFNGTPQSADVGRLSITIKASDAAGDFTESSFNLTVFDHVMQGTSDSETLEGTEENDYLGGDQGRDQLMGGDGEDQIVGGSGADMLTGGTGGDTFIYTNIRDRGDQVMDFDVTEDMLDFSALLDSFNYMGSDPIGEGYISWRALGNYTMILVDQDGTEGRGRSSGFILLHNVDPSTLTVDNFHL